MPRANRCFIAGHVWHITHRCHRKQFLLKFARDRRTWIRWLFEAKKRYGLCVLNYIVTSNHVHLLVKDKGHGEISASMQLVAGRTAQQYNQRKKRRGAFWEDRFHATAVATDEHLLRCMSYIDMNMVRAGVVRHPHEWDESGYGEIQRLPVRRRIVDLDTLMDLMAHRDVTELQDTLTKAVQAALTADLITREACWTESVAVGAREFVEDVKAKLNSRGRKRSVVAEDDDTFMLREPRGSYAPYFGS